MLAPTTKKERGAQMLHIILICLDVSYIFASWNTKFVEVFHPDLPTDLDHWSFLPRHGSLFLRDDWWTTQLGVQRDDRWQGWMDEHAGKARSFSRRLECQPFPIQIWNSTGKGALRDRERVQENLENWCLELIYFRDCIPGVTQRLPLVVPNVAKVLRKRWLSWQCSKKLFAATWMQSSPPKCSF